MNVNNVGKPSVVTLPVRRKFSEADVVKGRQNLPRRIYAFGGEKVGKTTFISGAPDPVFIPLDQGAPHLDIERLPKPESFDELLEIIALPEVWGKPWKTLILDPVNWAEEMVWARFLNGPNAKPNADTRGEIEAYGGGFQKGYDACVGVWRELQKALERQWQRGMSIVLVAHAKKVNFKDPSGVAYDRWEPAMDPRAVNVFKQWVDDILFLRHEVLAKVERNKTLAVETGERIIHTSWSKAWDAGCRATLPAELPMSWAAYAEAIEEWRSKVAEAADALRKEIVALTDAIGDAGVTKKAGAMVAAAKDDVERLAAIASGLRTKLNETASASTPTEETSK